MADVQLQDMAGEDVDAVVDVHLRSFPGFFLSFLGPKFLRLFYYEIARYPAGVARVAVDAGGQIVGFAAGVEGQSGFYHWLIRRRVVGFAWAAFGAFLHRPAIALRLLRALRLPADSGETAAVARLMSLAVLPEMEGQGVGRRLVGDFLVQMRAREIGSVSLTTDRDDNERANRFYRELGFRVAWTYQTPEGRWLNEYIIDLASLSDGPA